MLRLSDLLAVDPPTQHAVLQPAHFQMRRMADVASLIVGGEMEVEDAIVVLNGTVPSFAVVEPAVVGGVVAVG